MQTTTNSLEGLRASIKQRLEEKKQIDKDLADLYKSLNECIAALQQELNASMDVQSMSFSSQTNREPVTLNFEPLLTFVWKNAVQLVILAVVIWFLVSWMKGQKADSRFWELPQTPRAVAASLDDFAWEMPPVPNVDAGVPEVARVSLAVLDLRNALLAFEMGTPHEKKSLFERCRETWAFLESVVTESDMPLASDEALPTIPPHGGISSKPGKCSASAMASPSVRTVRGPFGIVRFSLAK